VTDSIQTLVQIRQKGDLSDALVRRTANELKKSLGINLAGAVARAKALLKWFAVFFFYMFLGINC
jgi:hypothetical protein